MKPLYLDYVQLAETFSHYCKVSVQSRQSSADGSECPRTIFLNCLLEQENGGLCEYNFCMYVSGENNMEIFTGLIFYIISLIRLITVDIIYSQ